jgi:hypothetical protein
MKHGRMQTLKSKEGELMETPITLRISRKLQGGICIECRQFRCCKYQTELNQLVCEGCVQALGNQSLLTLMFPYPSRKTRKAS